MQRMRFWRRSRPAVGPTEAEYVSISRSARDLADDASAFLEGRLVDRFAATNRIVPPWAWLVPLCNAGTEDLERVAQGVDGRWGSVGWPGAIGFLARQMIEAHNAGTDVERFQREVVVPYEESLRAGRYGLVTPAEAALCLDRELACWRSAR